MNGSAPREMRLLVRGVAFAVASSLAGRSPTYIFPQVYDIQQGKRAGDNMANMKPIVARLTTTDMIDIVAYLTSRMP